MKTQDKVRAAVVSEQFYPAGAEVLKKRSGDSWLEPKALPLRMFGP